MTGFDARPVAVTDRFAFHSHRWVNLHHFLYQWARKDGGPDGGDRRRPVAVPERDELAALTDAEHQAWQQAVGFYRDKLVALDLLFDDDMVFTGNQLAAPTALSAVGGERLPSGWLATPQNAAPVYEGHWWPRHDRVNRAWIDDVVPHLQRLAPLVAPGLARSYGGDWPDTPVRVEVSYYANWAGEIDRQTALDRMVAALSRSAD